MWLPSILLLPDLGLQLSGLVSAFDGLRFSKASSAEFLFSM
jgi:hypothetical protein